MFTATVRLLAAVAALSIATPAAAAWERASSEHFVIYADENPDELRAFADRLERFDQAARNVRGMGNPAIGLGNRLTVFVVRSDSDVQRLLGDKTGFVRGFYIPRASGSVAFVPRSSGSGSPWDLDAETVFFHEYAHHLMMQELDRPLPSWLIEGFAEFMSTARFEKDGSVGFGVAPKHRAWSLMRGVQLPIETMLSGASLKRGSEQHASLYARGWLLTHYLTFEPSRRGQLDKYIAGIADGVSPLDSAPAAFGDPKQLDRELDKYVERPRLPYVKVAAEVLKTRPIEIAPLSPGARAVLPLLARSRRGVNAQTAEPLAAQVRAIEARYPGDEFVEVALAEAEIDAGHPEASQAAADRALKADPRDTKALVLKGRAMGRVAQNLSASSRHAAFEQARHLLIAANKLDTEDPDALASYYRTFALEGIAPTTNAIEALHYASDLAPQDMGLRMASAARYLADGKLVEAKRALLSIAYNPHDSEVATAARALLTRIDAGAPAVAASQH